MNPKFKQILILGAGGVGYWLAIALCRMMRGQQVAITVYDPDTFEGGDGFRRLPKPLKDNSTKVSLLKTMVSWSMGDPLPHVHEKFFLPEDFGNGNQETWKQTLVVDATDMSLTKRVAIFDAAMAAGASYIRVSYDGLGIVTVSPGPPLFAEGAAGEGGYGKLPHIGHAMMAAGVGASAVDYYLYVGKCLELQFTIPVPEEVSNVV
jgi:hypothetical protein